MRIPRLFWPLMLLVLLATPCPAENKIDEKFLPDTTAGQEVKIAGTFEGEGTWHANLVYLGPTEKTLPPLATKVSDDKKSLSFTLPTDLKDGRYGVTLTLDGAAGTISTLAVPELRILALAVAQVTITTVRPVSPYPDPNPVAVPSPTPNASPTPTPGRSPLPKGTNQYDFEIAGTNFSPIPENNHVEVDGVPIETPGCDKGAVPCLSAEAGSETRKLIVRHFSPPAFSRPLSVSVRVGDGPNVATAPEPLVFSSISKTALQIYAVGAFAVLLLIVFGLVRAGVKLGKIDGQKYGSLRAFLIDRETNSYSLSKFQLTLFTLVSVFGYIYVYVCTLFVQCKFVLPPVPEGLPGMLAVSVGTTVVAAGIGAKIGGKGAGPSSPSPADFITSGGIVLPERFQFFLWTIVSSVGVLVLILASDPVTLTELPKLPDGMLYLMGLSSVGYLGGKLARGPGPSVKSIDAAKAEAGVGLDFTLTGSNLSSDASFQIDDEQIPSAQVTATPIDKGDQDPKLCSTLKVELKDVSARYFDGQHLFRIVNPDSQGADVKYGATIDSVGAVKDGKITVTGSNFKDPSSAGWTTAPDSGEPVADLGVKPAVDLGVKAVTKKSETELEITLNAGLTGKGKLTITSPGKLTTRIDVDLGQETPVMTPPTTPGAETPKKEPESPLETPSETPLIDATKTDGGEDLPDPPDEDPGA